MKIIISNSSAIPIYEQIKNTIINQIMSGELQDGEALPSIRVLAQDIRISVMTIKKAYDELEEEGYIVTRHGKGSFVALRNPELVQEQAKREMEEHFLAVIQLMKQFDIAQQDVLDLFEFLLESEL